MRPNTKFALFLTLATLASFGLGFGAATFVKSPQEVAAQTAPVAASPLTAVVEAGPLVSLDTQSGKVVATDTRKVSVHKSVEGSIVTGLPMHAGESLTQVSLLAVLADRPLFALEGPIPMIRDLTTGDTGQDVQRFQEALEAAGYEIFDTPGIFGPSTATAVRAIYRLYDYDPPTGPGPARATTDDPAPAPTATPAPTAAAASTQQQPQPYVIAKQSEFLLLPGATHLRIQSYQTAVGQELKSPFVTLTDGNVAIDTQIPPGQLAAWQVGTEVRVEATGGTAELVGTVSSLGEPVKTEESGFVAPVRVTCTGDTTALSPETPAQLTVTTSHGSETDLVIPLSALQTASNGTQYVEQFSNNTRTQHTVTLLESVDGLALIAPTPGLEPGVAVIVGKA